MKNRSKRARKLLKSEQSLLTNVAKSIGGTLGSIAGRTQRLRKKSRTIGTQARTLARKTRKRVSAAARPRRRGTLTSRILRRKR